MAGKLVLVVAWERGWGCWAGVWASFPMGPSEGLLGLPHSMVSGSKEEDSSLLQDIETASLLRPDLYASTGHFHHILWVL